jgi:WD40 repeat protein
MNGVRHQAETFNREKEPLCCFAISPDGKFVAGGSAASLRADPKIHIWEAVRGKEVGQLKKFREILNQKQGVRWLAFSGDGKTIASADEGGAIHLWQPTTGRRISQFIGTPIAAGAGLQTMALSPDGGFIAQAADDYTIALWDTTRGKQLHRLQGHEGEVRALTFSSDSRTLVSGSRDKRVLFWEVPSGRQIREMSPFDRSIETIALSPDGKRLVAGSDTDWIGNSDVDHGGGSGWRPHGWRVMALSSDGKTLATGDGCGNISLFELTSGRMIRQLAGLVEPSSLAFSPDGQLLASARMDTILLSKVSTGEELHRLKWDEGLYFRSLAFSPDGKTLASGQAGPNAWSGFAALWDVGSGRQLCRIVDGHRTGWVAYSPDGKLLATVHQILGNNVASRDLVIWDLASRTQVQRLQVPFDVYRCTFSPDGRFLASYGGAKANPPELRVRGELYSADLGDAIQLWNMTTGKKLHRFPGNPTEVPWSEPKYKERLVRAIVFSPDGKTLASVEGNLIYLYETFAGKVRQTLVGHQEPVVGAAFVPGGRLLVSASNDATVLIWDLSGRVQSRQVRESSLTSEQLEGLWANLADSKAPTAYRSIWSLTAAPEQAASFLKSRVRPVSPIDPKLIKRLIADLDHARFTTRQKATEDLESLGDRVQPNLEQTLAARPSMEVHRRIEGLLESWTRRGIPSEELRILRAIEVLEKIGTSNAREVLQVLTQGSPEARPTQEAKASLARLRTPGAVLEE